MFKDILEALFEYLKNYVKHRLFLVSILMVALFSILIMRLFRLQIIEGKDHLDNFNYKIERNLPINASRGNIYDRNGKLLAYNKIVYSVTFSNSSRLSQAAEKTGISENELKNQIVYKTIQVLKKHGNDVINDLSIYMKPNGQLDFNVSDSQKQRFLADIYGKASVDDLSLSQANSSADDVFEYLKGEKMFALSDDYNKKDALDIIAVRYSLWLNRFQQYVPVVIARDISREAMSEIQESNNELLGMDVIVDSIRQYNDAKYVAHIIGYIGNISTDDLESYNKELPDGADPYESSDKVGKSGIEKVMESELRGKKGTQKMYVDNLGRVLDIADTSDAEPGHDVYLTINTDLNIYCYEALEQEIASILLSYMTPGTATKNKKGDVLIPQYKVYFGLFNNNVISLDHMKESGASEKEQKIYRTVIENTEFAVADVREELTSGFTPVLKLSDTMESYIAYVYRWIHNANFFDSKALNEDDQTYIDYQNDKISFGEYLQYAVTKGAIDVDSFEIDTDYYNSEELYNLLVDYIIDYIRDDNEFQKLVIENLLRTNKIDCLDVAMVLYDQGVLDRDKDTDYSRLATGNMSAYGFIRKKIAKFEITPAQLALDPCSGSVVVTDVNSGEVLAMVSYPSYDINKLTNSVDANYYARVYSDKTTPLYNRATQQRTAPGSTFKMVTSAAVINEGKLPVNGTIQTKGVFDKAEDPVKCWIYRSGGGTHGVLDIPGALENSCNYFFYECSYRLGTKENGVYSDSRGLSMLRKYAELFGLGETSGIELSETEPKISDRDAIRSAIGQGTHNYTATQLSKYVSTVANSGTSYNLSLVKYTQDFNGNTVYQNPHTVSATVDLSSGVWDAIHKGMRRVVYKHTDANALINRINVKVAGKTGTAQESANRPSHSLFVSYAPYDSPEVSVTVQIPFGYSSGNAEELASFIYAYMYDPDKLNEVNVSGNSNVAD